MTPSVGIAGRPDEQTCHRCSLHPRLMYMCPHSRSKSHHKLHRCQKPAKLQCPKCQELSLPKATSSFCSQECFKVSWVDLV